MVTRYSKFMCTSKGCNYSVSNHVLVAETEDEFERLKKAIVPPFAELTNNQCVKQFHCPEKGCKGFVNVIIGETSY